MSYDACKKGSCIGIGMYGGLCSSHEIDRLRADLAKAREEVASLQSGISYAVERRQKESERALAAERARDEAVAQLAQAKICDAWNGKGGAECGKCYECMGAKAQHTLNRVAAERDEAVAEVARLKEALKGLLAASERMVDKAPVMGRAEAEAMDTAVRALGRTDGEG